MENLPPLPFQADDLPKFLGDLMPQLWVGLLGFTLLVLSYCVGVGTKRLYRRFGQEFYGSSENFYGSSWDLSAPIVQILVNLLALTIGAELLGFEIGQQLNSFWPKLLAGLLIVVGAVLLSTWINRSIRAYAERIGAQGRFDDTLITFSGAIIRYFILGVAILMALSQMGFAPASLVTVLGAMGLALALALQDTLKAVAAGFLLAIFRPFRIGDWVEIDNYDGEITNVTPFTTSLNRVDNTKVILTNDKVWGSAIINYSRNKDRRLDLYFRVHYDTDLNFALTTLTDVANSVDNIIRIKNTWVGVHDLGDWAVTLRLRIWTKSINAVQVRVDIMKSVKENFQKVGIVIPYRQQVEHVGKTKEHKQPTD